MARPREHERSGGGAADAHCSRGVSRSTSHLSVQSVSVSERREPKRTSENVEDRLERHLAKVPYFRIYDLRSTYATRLSAGGVADEWVTQLLRQGEAKVFKKYSQMKLQMKHEALVKLNRMANEQNMNQDPGYDTATVN